MTSRLVHVAAGAALALVGLVAPASAAQADDGPAERPHVKIACEEEGFFGNPNDASRFYRCVDFKGTGESFTIFHFECGEGTVWDNSLTTCNHASEVEAAGNLSGPIVGRD